MMHLILNLLSTVITVYAAPPQPPSSTATSINTVIEQAQQLAIDKKRTEALQLLNETANSASTMTPKNRQRLSETLNQIAKAFFTDKGQRLYESAQTAVFENPDIAMGRYREALALEDGNVLVLNGIAHSQLAKMDCNGALQTIQNARALSLQLAEPALLELRALLCLGNFESFREKVKALPPIEKAQDYFLQFLMAQDYFQQKMWKRANDILLKITEDQPKFPETYYWLHRARIELEDQDNAFAQRYISLCKNLTVRERKRYSLEPRLCATMKEVEDEVVKKRRDS